MFTNKPAKWLLSLLLLCALSACLPFGITLPGALEFPSVDDLQREFDLPFIQLNSTNERSASGENCAREAAPSIEGSGVQQTESRAVSEFSELVLTGFGTIIVQQTSQESLSIQADENILPYLETRVVGDALWLEFSENACVHPSDIGITYFVSLKDLNLIRIAGAGAVELEHLKTDELSIQLDGTGKIDLAGLEVDQLETNFNGTGVIQLAGYADAQYVSLNGVGQYQAAQLESDSVHVKLNGTGNVEVWAVSDLWVTSNGLGRVRYIGDPQIHQASSGFSEMERMRQQ